MGLDPKSVRASNGDYALGISTTSTGFASLGCLMDSVEVNDSREVTVHETFCDAADDIKGKLAAGRDVSITATLELVIGAAGLGTAKTAYEANTEVYVQESMTSVDGLGTLTTAYRGYITDFGKSVQLKGVVRRKFKLDVNEVVSS